jgi:hypothetical protein
MMCSAAASRSLLPLGGLRHGLIGPQVPAAPATSAAVNAPCAGQLEKIAFCPSMQENACETKKPQEIASHQAFASHP